MAFTYNYTPQIEALQKQIDNYGQFQYGKENAYQKALAAVTNPAAFSYDVENDPVYTAYRKQYLREGDRAMADTLAKLSAMTGGRPSSYAVMAAQQAGNYYNSQLTDVIPTLFQNAYQRYLNGLDQQKDALSILAADREAALSQHQNNYDILLENLEHLQQLQEQQKLPAVTGPTYSQVQQDRKDLQSMTNPATLDRFNRAKDAFVRTNIPNPIRNANEESNSSVLNYVDTDAIRSFKSSLMPGSEYAKIEGQYKTYNNYLETMIDQWLSNGKLTADEAATLMSYYNLV